MGMIESVRKSVRSAMISSASWAMTKAAGPGGWLGQGYGPPPMSYPTNWFQLGMDLPGLEDYETFGPVASCISIISQDLSRIPLDHVSIGENRAATVIHNRAPARLFRNPNNYQTIVDFLLYIGRSMLSDGNAYAIAKRNDRFEVTALYPIHPKACWPYLTDTGEVYYRLTGDPTADIGDIEVGDWYPQRDVWHMRLQTPRHPLVGETPLVAAKYPTMTGQEINRHTAAFFHNMARPSGILRHPGRLDETAMRRIKERWMDISTKQHTGEPAVLVEGMEWQQLDMTAVDSELAAIYKISEKQIFQLYRVPGFLLGDTERSAFGSSVESLIRFYLQSCLSFYENLIEKSLTKFLRLPPNEEIRFNIDEAMLRGDLKERIEAYAKGIQNAVFTPNDARQREGLPPLEDGDDGRVQQQLVPLSYGKNLEPPTPGQGSPPAANGDDADADAEENKTLAHYRSLKKVLDL